MGQADRLQSTEVYHLYNLNITFHQGGFVDFHFNRFVLGERLVMF